MSYPIIIKAVICYIEAHIKDEKFDYDELCRRVGFSRSYVRSIFKRYIGVPIAKYVTERKVKCSLSEIVNTDRAIIDIAYQYGFSSPETYLRAVNRVIGMTPSEFRRRKNIVGKEELCPGVYGVGILLEKEHRSDIKMNREIYKNNESTVLYGVPKVEFGAYGGGTPYPICLKSCAEYLGEDIKYHYIMASCMAAFRLVWNSEEWDLSNVDIFHTLCETNEIYGLGARALGREFEFLGRDVETTKDEFVDFIKHHIDEGYPCIALGIIGPPEPCIITGYRENGDVLLGWNFFQNDPEFSGNLEFDESGYFVCRDFWENTDTQAVMCMGALESEGEKIDDIKIIKNAADVLSGRRDYCYSKGIEAYGEWKKALLNEREFSVCGNYTVLFEKLLCHLDAVGCIIDGRRASSEYFYELSEKDSYEKEKYLKIAEVFNECSSEANKMKELLDCGDMDSMLEKFSERKTREVLCSFIEKARDFDSKALELMKELI